MERKVLLGADRFVGIKDRFIAGDETILAFESIDYDLDELQATVTDGSIAKRHPVRNARFDISEYCKKAGVLEIKIDLMKGGAVVKSWCLEPFVVRENGGGYELIPEIALLRKEIRTMKRIMKELNSKINDTM